MNFFLKILLCLSLVTQQVFACEKDVIRSLTFRAIKEIFKKYDLNSSKYEMHYFDKKNFDLFIVSKLEDRYNDLINGSHKLLYSEVNDKLKILSYILGEKTYDEDFFKIKLKILSEELNKKFSISNEFSAEIIENEDSNDLQFFMICLFILED